MKNFAQMERDFVRKMALPDFDWEHFDAPSRINPLQVPVSSAKVALVGTAGAYIKTTQHPFALKRDGDPSFREIPSSTQISELGLSHPGYDTRCALQDPNVVFPLDRLRELKERGVIGDIAPHAFSFMGYSPQAGVLQENAAQVAGELAADKVDLVLMVPA
jgi:D-proline reductase (dithiol) PrdB